MHTQKGNRAEIYPKTGQNGLINVLTFKKSETTLMWYKYFLWDLTQVLSVVMAKSMSHHQFSSIFTFCTLILLSHQKIKNAALHLRNYGIFLSQLMIVSRLQTIHNIHCIIQKTESVCMLTTWNSNPYTFVTSRLEQVHKLTTQNILTTIVLSRCIHVSLSFY